MSNDNSDEVFLIESSDSGSETEETTMSKFLPTNKSEIFDNQGTNDKTNVYLAKSPVKLAVFFGDLSMIPTQSGTQFSDFDRQNANNFKMFVNKVGTVNDFMNQTKRFEEYDDDVVFVGEYKTTSESECTKHSVEDEFVNNSSDKNGALVECSMDLEKQEENDRKVGEENPVGARRNPRRQARSRTLPYQQMEAGAWGADRDDSENINSIHATTVGAPKTSIDIKIQPKPRKSQILPKTPIAESQKTFIGFEKNLLKPRNSILLKTADVESQKTLQVEETQPKSRNKQMPHKNSIVESPKTSKVDKNLQKRRKSVWFPENLNNIESPKTPRLEKNPPILRSAKNLPETQADAEFSEISRAEKKQTKPRNSEILEESQNVEIFKVDNNQTQASESQTLPEVEPQQSCSAELTLQEAENEINSSKKGAKKKTAKPKSIAQKRKNGNKRKREEGPDFDGIVRTAYANLHNILSYSCQVAEYNDLYVASDEELTKVQDLMDTACNFYCMVADVSHGDLTKYLEETLSRPDLKEYLQTFE